MARREIRYTHVSQIVISERVPLLRFCLLPWPTCGYLPPCVCLHVTCFLGADNLFWRVSCVHVNVFVQVSYVEAGQRYGIIEAVIHLVNRDFVALADLYKRLGFIPQEQVRTEGHMLLFCSAFASSSLSLDRSTVRQPRTICGTITCILFVPLLISPVSI